MLVKTQAYSELTEQTRRNELILAHLGLVRHVLGKLAVHLPAGVDLENLESAGTLGLVEAANKFDPDRGNQFKTYAYIRIRGAILDELRRNCPLPQQMLERAAPASQGLHNPVPGASLEELAGASGLSTDEVADCLAALRLTRMMSRDSSSDPLDACVNQRDTPPDVLAIRSEEKELLARGIGALPERERLVVTMYYMEDLRLKEIGLLLELSESRVSRLLSAAMFRLSEYLKSHKD